MTASADDEGASPAPRRVSTAVLEARSSRPAMGVAALSGVMATAA